MSIRCSLSCLTALALLVPCAAHGTFEVRAQSDFAGPPPEAADRRLNASALNALLAFGPYRDLAGARRRGNILFSPLGLASAAALLTRASGSEGRSRALELLGLAANATERSAEDAVSSLRDLLHDLSLPEGRAGGGAQGAGSEAGPGPDGGSDAGGQLKVWSGLHAGGNQSDFQSFLSGNPEEGSKDWGSSDEVQLDNYAYFKGS